MSSDPPEEWLALSSHRRDILVTLDVDGPGSGYGLWERIGEDVTPPTTHRNLQALIDAGLVAVSPKDDRENAYQITDDGRALVDAAREWMRV